MESYAILIIQNCTYFSSLLSFSLLREGLYSVARSSEPFLSSLNYILAVEDAYLNVLSLIFGEIDDAIPSSSSNDLFQKEVREKGFLHLKRKLCGTVRTLGSEVLVNTFIESACRASEETSASTVLGGNPEWSSVNGDCNLKAALRCHILLTQDKASRGSMDTRKIVRQMTKYSSPASLALLEGLWREVITESVLSLCTPPQTPGPLYYNPRSPSPPAEDTSPFSTRASGIGFSINPIPGSPLSCAVSGPSALTPQRSFPVPTPEIFASTLVDTLLQHLAKAREASSVDLRSLGCCMSADLAFTVAYRRLPRESGVELAKALAVKISALLDRTKRPASYSRNNGSASLHDIADLIRVLFSQTSKDFQLFYEVLLARRLLRCRFSSLEAEREMINLLPALDKSLLMIR